MTAHLERYSWDQTSWFTFFPCHLLDTQPLWILLKVRIIITSLEELLEGLNEIMHNNELLSTTQNIQNNVWLHSMVQGLHCWARRNFSQHTQLPEGLDEINNEASLRNRPAFPPPLLFLSVFLPQSIWKMRISSGFRDLWFVCTEFKSHILMFLSDQNIFYLFLPFPLFPLKKKKSMGVFLGED